MVLLAGTFWARVEGRGTLGAAEDLSVVKQNSCPGIICVCEAHILQAGWETIHIYTEGLIHILLQLCARAGFLKS